MKLYEVPVQEKADKTIDVVSEVKRGINHLVISDTVPNAKAKTKEQFGPRFKVGKPNMIFDFNPK